MIGELVLPGHLVRDTLTRNIYIVQGSENDTFVWVENEDGELVSDNDWSHYEFVLALRPNHIQIDASDLDPTSDDFETIAANRVREALEQVE